jgi:hypothetical protein
MIDNQSIGEPTRCYISSIKPKTTTIKNNKTIVVDKHFCKIEMVDIGLENGQSRQKMKMAES